MSHTVKYARDEWFKALVAGLEARLEPVGIKIRATMVDKLGPGLGEGVMIQSACPVKNMGGATLSVEIGNINDLTAENAAKLSEMMADDLKRAYELQ